MARSLNKVTLIGNVTKNPDARSTQNGASMTTFSVATNRNWVRENGEKMEETEFHRIVAWSKLGELCKSLLVKGSRVYVEGRISTRKWDDTDGATHQITEIIADEMIVLSKGASNDEETGD